MKKQQSIFITVKKYPPLHYKNCQSCPFHQELLNIDNILLKSLMNVLINLIVLI